MLPRVSPPGDQAQPSGATGSRQSHRCPQSAASSSSTWGDRPWGVLSLAMDGIWGWAVDGAPAQHLLCTVSEVTPLWAQSCTNQAPSSPAAQRGRVHHQEEEGHGELRAGAVLVWGGYPFTAP